MSNAAINFVAEQVVNEIQTIAKNEKCGRLSIKRWYATGKEICLRVGCSRNKDILYNIINDRHNNMQNMGCTVIAQMSPSLSHVFVIVRS